MDNPKLQNTETKSANAPKPMPRRFDPTRLFIQRDRLPWFWFFFTIAVLLLSAIDRDVYKRQQHLLPRDALLQFVQR